VDYIVGYLVKPPCSAFLLYLSDCLSVLFRSLFPKYRDGSSSLIQKRHKATAHHSCRVRYASSAPTAWCAHAAPALAQFGLPVHPPPRAKGPLSGIHGGAAHTVLAERVDSSGPCWLGAMPGARSGEQGARAARGGGQRKDHRSDSIVFPFRRMGKRISLKWHFVAMTLFVLIGLAPYN
jgi:hypothetical protein